MSTKELIRYYYVESTNTMGDLLFQWIPNTGIWRMYQNGTWEEATKTAENWFHRIMMSSDFMDYEETTDKEVFKQWLKEADKQAK